MSVITNGDAARFFSLRQDVARLNSELKRASDELGTGRKADLGTALSGDFSTLADLRRGLRLNDSFVTGLSNAAVAASGRQAALDRVTVEIEAFGPTLLSATASGRTAQLDQTLADAPDRLDAAIAALNMRQGGQSLFAGNRPDQDALIDAQTLLDTLRPIATAAPDAATAIAAIDAWFNDAGGGFETSAYLGGLDRGATVFLAEGLTTSADVRANDPGIRTALAGLTMAALAAEGSVPAVAGAQSDVAEAAASRMIDGQARLVDIRANLGAQEGRIEAARVRAEATRTALELEEARLTSVDPYEAATELEAMRLQLESMYVLTARLSNLSLTAYLR